MAFPVTLLLGSSYFELLLDCPPWGLLLLALSAFILLTVVFCTTAAGLAFRCGSTQSLAQLPPRLDEDGLLDLRDRSVSGALPSAALRRALRIGLVAGRGGLLLSKSAVLTAWEAEQTAFRMWPRIAAAAGLVSLSLGALGAVHQAAWIIEDWARSGGGPIRPGGETILGISRCQAILAWGLTNFFVALLVYVVYERVTQAFLNRTTRALIEYLGAEAGGEGVVAAPNAREK